MFVFVVCSNISYERYPVQFIAKYVQFIMFYKVYNLLLPCFWRPVAYFVIKIKYFNKIIIYILIKHSFFIKI